MEKLEFRLIYKTGLTNRLSFDNHFLNHFHEALSSLQGSSDDRRADSPFETPITCLSKPSYEYVYYPQFP